MIEREMDKEEEGEAWGTLEELLLACAVNRHGPHSWDSVSAELRSHTSDHHHHLLFAPANCRRRYSDILLRFSGDDAAVVDELRKLRVAELRREVERHDDSIEFLELKLKRLEKESEERERKETDLSSEPAIKKPVVESVSGDRENRSLNESNSTTGKKVEPESLDNEPEKSGPKPVRSEVKPEGTELCDSVGESKRSGDSSSKKNRRRRGRFVLGSSSGEDEPDGDEVPLAAKQIVIKCQPLIKILAILRAHKNGSVFERRLRSQESEKYKKMIRQHVDLQTVQRRLDKGIYLHSQRKFFRDLLLLFANALIFFPKNSNEFSIATDLRTLVITHMAKTIPKPAHNVKKPEPVPTQFKRAPSPIVVCRRKSVTGSKQASNHAIAVKAKEVDVKTNGKNSNISNAKAKDKVVVKKQKAKENNSRVNKQKILVKESSSDDSDDDDDDEELDRGTKSNNGKSIVTKGKTESRRDRDRDRDREREDNSKMGKRLGRPGKGSSPPVAAVGRGVKRGKEGGSGGAMAEEMGRTRKRLRR